MYSTECRNERTDSYRSVKPPGATSLGTLVASPGTSGKAAHPRPFTLTVSENLPPRGREKELCYDLFSQNELIAEPRSQGIGPERGVRVGVEAPGGRWICLARHQPRRPVVRVTVAPVVNRDHIQQHDIPIGGRYLAQRTGERAAHRREHAPKKGAECIVITITIIIIIIIVIVTTAGPRSLGGFWATPDLLDGRIYLGTGGDGSFDLQLPLINPKGKSAHNVVIGAFSSSPKEGPGVGPQRFGSVSGPKTEKTITFDHLATAGLFETGLSWQA
uniref:Uncharacterized protein n=1 Tax=Anopheles farauti TaxID=69004 RepID=A0A182QME2_9DIPT